MVRLKDYQKVPIDFLLSKKNKGLIIIHGLGTGKTITSIGLAEQFQDKKVIVVTPASLRKNYEKELEKASRKPERYTIVSYEGFGLLLESDKKILNDKILIVDEAHRLRNPENSYNVDIIEKSKEAFKVILLTGTPIINEPYDIMSLIKMIDHKKYMNHIDFERKFLKLKDKGKKVIRNKKKFKKLVENMFSFYMPEDLTEFPNKKVHHPEVSMSKEQFQAYKKAEEDKLSPNELHFINNTIEYNRNKKTKATRQLNSFLNATRQISNTVQGNEDSPKIQKIVEKIIKGPKPVLVYSNYKGNGILPVSRVLMEKKIRHKNFTGALKDSQKKNLVEQFNNGEFDVLLVTSSGGEGLDLKRIRQVHIMEPHWNESKINQVIGRAVRYQSHIDLPKKEQVVDVYHWISVFTRKTKGKQTADQYLYEISERKKKIAKDFYKIIINSSIENLSKYKGKGKSKKQKGGSKLMNLIVQ